MGEEKCRQPVSFKRALLQPVAEEYEAAQEIRVPGGKWLERGVAVVRPQIRHLVKEQTLIHAVELA